MIYIDGYNVMHKLPQLRTLLRRGDLEQARMRFLLLLKSISLPAEWGRPEVIFDGEGNNTGVTVEQGIRLRFSSHQQSADELIRDLLAGREQQRNLVISSDNEVQSFARRHGATAAGAEWLLERFQRSQALPDADEKPNGISKADLDEFLRLFGEEEEPEW